MSRPEGWDRLARNGDHFTRAIREGADSMILHSQLRQLQRDLRELTTPARTELFTNVVGPEIPHAVEGQRVSVIFDGVLVRVDPESHGLVLRGNTRGAQHIPWEMEFHWASTLFDPGPGVDRETPPIGFGRPHE